MSDWLRRLWFDVNSTSGWDTCPWPISSSRKDACCTTPTYFNCSPKACWVSGKLKKWSVVKETHAESGEQGAQRFMEKLVQHLQQSVIKTVVTMSIEELLIWAVIWVSRYALHPPLWDAVTWWAHWKTEDEQKIHCYFGTCVSASLFPFLNTLTHTHCNKEILHNLPQPTHTRCYINMQQSLWFITSSQMDC